MGLIINLLRILSFHLTMNYPKVNTLRLILGDQLNRQHSWFDTIDEQVAYCFFETHSEATYVKHHIQKVCAFFSAMRKFAKELELVGHKVIYHQLDEVAELKSIPDKVKFCLQQCTAEHFEYQLPDEHRLDEALKSLCQEIEQSSKVVDSEHFLSTRTEVAETFKGKKTYLMETFYRNMRRKHHILMEENGEPLTGKWNYDHDNRGKLPTKLVLPKVKRFAHNVSEIIALLQVKGIETIGRIPNNEIYFPLDRKEALAALKDFCSHRLIHFGDYQDALTIRDNLLFHSLLSFAMNVKMLSPLEVCQAVIAEWEKRPDEISINQPEGFIRQVIGWREYMRGVYWAKMPDYAKTNFFDHQAKLPTWYWTGNTKMKCLNQSINESLDNAYAHHIQRLMVTGNFALLIGTHPDEVDAWYLGVYIDALEWVEITNTRGMSQWADGGLVATKPYISSANYIHKQGDYCKNCFYDRKLKVGDRACPYNSLYWDFLHRHEDKLRNNFRMRMIYRVWDRFNDDTKVEIIQKADWVKKNIEIL